VISDTGSFFQCSFVKALETWFGDDHEYDATMALIAEGKDLRNEFGYITDYVRDYNKLEILMLEALMEKFRKMCTGIGIRPYRWQGPGNLVSAVFNKHKIPRNEHIQLETRFPGLRQYANNGYYGGRFEACQIGDITGPIHQYDINSAYAATYATLPCMVHTTWNKQTTIPADGCYISDVSFEHPDGLFVNTLPVRTVKGSIVFPRFGRGTYFSPELQLAKSMGVKLTIHSAWVAIRHCDCSYFDWVPDMYVERKRIGKSGQGIVLKITLATIYGKLCQSVGSASWANPVWAGLITSTVRGQLAQAALANGDGHDVVMLATDGLFCRESRSLPVSKDIGEWDHEVHSDMFVIQSGVYVLPHEKIKTRGVPHAKVKAGVE
ncbi:MAG: DNA polymerase, partial [Candidatus Saccharimonadales bacterium]